MARVTGRKVPVSHSGQGGAVPFDFNAGSEYAVFGFHMHPTRRIAVQVPVFDHGFYPKLDHTQHEIDGEVQQRQVIMPSLADLRAAGINAEHAIYAADIHVHPRYIKHRNYFRTDFPANMKAFAKREGIVIVFPANDIISARFKRKETLALWRAAFTPLLIEGKQYTSGRITHFFVAPPQVSQAFRMKLNLEHDEEANLLCEWDPVSWRLAQQRPTHRPNLPQRVPMMSRYEIQDTADRLADELAPLVTSKLDVNLTREQQERLHAIISDDEMARTLIVQTKNKTGTTRLAAIKRWWNTTAWPEVKQFLIDEGIQMSRAIMNFIFVTTVSVAVDAMLHKAQGSHRVDLDTPAGKRFAKMHPWKTALNRGVYKFKYTPSNAATRTQLGAGTLEYQHKPQAANTEKTEINQILRERAAELYVAFTGDREIGIHAEEIFNITVSASGQVRVSLDQRSLQDFIDHREINGMFGRDDPSQWINRVQYTWIPKIAARLQELYDAMKLEQARYGGY